MGGVHPYDARQLARELMRRHGLDGDGWRFDFDHARRRFGCCRYGPKMITLSKPLTLLNGEAEVRDTLLHEIAHALCPGDGHGPRWRATCRQIRARPPRAGRVPADRPPPPAVLRRRRRRLPAAGRVEVPLRLPGLRLVGGAAA